MSSFSWLDHSEAQRRRMLEVVAMFRQEDTIDELGIGSVRDAFSNLLFPGTSTIQTRARYFLFIPWIYRRLEGRRILSDRIAARARADELRLIEALRAGGEREGLIGRDAGRALKRLPSNAYWNGLWLWGIRLFPGSQEQYHRSLDGFYRRRTGSHRSDDGEFYDAPPSNWHRDLPEAPDDVLQETSFTLTDEEAEYLQERIVTSHAKTLLACVVSHGRTKGIDFPWEHPNLGEFPAEVQDQLEHARNFSDVIWGASLLYNRMLAEKKTGREDLVADYDAALELWAATVQERLPELRAWDREAFWFTARRPSRDIGGWTVTFVRHWMDITLNRADAVRDDERARDLIRNRERDVKQQRARLWNDEALDRWQGASSADQLDYRWGTVRVIVDDIVSALPRRRRARA